MMVAVGTDLEGRAREIKGSLDLVIPPLFERGVFFVRGLLLDVDHGFSCTYLCQMFSTPSMDMGSE